jgi:Tfp pilus assembly protein PilP
VKPTAASKGATVVAEAGKPAPAPKVVVAKAEPLKLVPAPKAAAASKPEPLKPEPKTASKEQPKTVVAAKSAPASEVTVAAAPADKTSAAQQPKPQDKKWAMSGKRDPFFSPVVQQNGSGCSTGKKCLEINAINLRGVVKSDAGFIAVVTNNLGKAYFLRENDPVFNGYVVRITGDSVTFSETIQDKLGKPFNREVVKKIFTPAV